MGNRGRWLCELRRFRHLGRRRATGALVHPALVGRRGSLAEGLGAQLVAVHRLLPPSGDSLGSLRRRRRAGPRRTIGTLREGLYPLRADSAGTLVRLAAGGREPNANGVPALPTRGPRVECVSGRDAQLGRVSVARPGG